MGINYTPDTWVFEENVTAEKLNEQVRDPLTGLQAAWDSYSVVWDASTAPAIGNGTLEGRYLQIGRTIIFSVRMQAGSTTTFGTGSFLFSLPVPARGGFNYPILGSVTLYDNSAPARQTRNLYLSSPTQCVPTSEAGQNIANTVPWTWANGDRISILGLYEAA